MKFLQNLPAYTKKDQIKNIKIGEEIKRFYINAKIIKSRLQ
jgi:hypothetical protein